jgi:preprotein translocase subunit YajC
MYLQSALGGGFGSFGLIMIAMVAVMYFVTIAPNQKKQKAWQAMLDGLKSGDRVTTTGGLRGVILQVKDDAVIVRIQPDNLKLEFVKSSIAAVTTDEPKS